MTHEFQDERFDAKYEMSEERQFRENEDRNEFAEMLRREAAQRDGGFSSYDRYE
jgi:hypothetical protein